MSKILSQRMNKYRETLGISSSHIAAPVSFTTLFVVQPYIHTPRVRKENDT